MLLFLFVAAEASYGGWIYSYAVKLNVGTGDDSRLSDLCLLGRTDPRPARLDPAGIPASARLPILLGNILGCLAGLAIVLLGRGPAARCCGPAHLSSAFRNGPLFPTTISFASTRMTTTGRVTAWFLVGGSLGVMTLPWIIGQLFEPLGPQIAMRLITLAMVLSVWGCMGC